MRILVVLVVSFLFHGTASGWYPTDYDTVSVTYPDGQLKEYYTRAWYLGNEKGFHPHGLYTSWYETGQLKEQGNYDWNKKIGPWIEWNEEGTRIVEANYWDGKLHGMYIERYPDNTLKVLVNYKNGKKYGLWVERKQGEDIDNPDLFIEFERLYFDDRILMIKYENSKFVASVPEYYNKELNLFVEWSFNSPYYSFGARVDGNKDGKWLKIDRMGNILKTEIWEKGSILCSD